jgi:hypothetical protein
MQTKMLTPTSLVGAVICGAAVALAQGQETAKDRYFLNYRAGFNIHASFNAPALGLLTPPPLAGSGATGNPVAREYEDGFVRVDSTGNAGGYTSYWGYNNDSQVQGVGSEGGGSLLLRNSVSATSPGGLKQTDDPQRGVEIMYQHELARNAKLRVGIELAFNYTWLDIRASRTAPAMLTRIIDAYPLEGITPPLAPFVGTLDGPGPLISDQFTRTTVTEAAVSWSIANSRKLDGQLYGLRIGPYLEFPLTESVAFSLSAGLAGGYIDTRFSYRDSLSDGAGGVLASDEGSRSKNGFLAGAYVEGMFTVAVGQGMSLFAGAQWQYLNSWTVRAGEQEVKLDFSKSVFVSAGVSFEF